MKTKIFFSVLLGIMALAMSSCSRTEYRPVDDNYAFMIKKIDGKRQWGIVNKNDKTIYIPCQYDSVFSANNAPYNIKHLFIGIKNGKMYALDTWYGELLGGEGFTSLVSSEQIGSPHNNKSIVGGGVLFHEAKTDDGIIFFYQPLGEKAWVEYGPAEAMLWTGNRVLYKKQGKWGISTRKGDSIVANIYDEIISVNEDYFWAKKNGEWSSIDLNGHPIRKSHSLLNKYKKLPSLSSEDYTKQKTSATFRKISVQEASYIAVRWTNASYISW